MRPRYRPKGASGHLASASAGLRKGDYARGLAVDRLPVGTVLAAALVGVGFAREGVDLCFEARNALRQLLV
ncbi:MAG: hypothetical protein ACK4MD_10770, partial [Demequina sp.]